MSFPVLPENEGVHRIVLSDGRHAVFKRRRDMPADFFAAEVRGLEALRTADELRVPKVFAVQADSLLLEDLGTGPPRPDFHADAGRRLAYQHSRQAPRFGFSHDGWCGDTSQDNTPDDDGHRFFAERRLLPQMRRAREAGRLDSTDARRIESICTRLPGLTPPQPPVLLHGDLWSGNLHSCSDGTPALIDAGAAHYGWAETELAMLTLFGAPPPAFFDSYAEAAPSIAGWRSRAHLYNLYHLLNHLNLFGAGYLGGVRRVLRRFS